MPSVYTVDGIRVSTVQGRTKQTARMITTRGAALMGVGGMGIVSLLGDDAPVTPVKTSAAVTVGLLGLLGVSVWGVIKVYGVGGRRRR
jgi:hypothetical protein